MRSFVLDRLVFRYTILFASFFISLFSSCEASVNSSSEHFARDLSLEEVRKAITKASPGDTIIVPEGTATWNDQLVITKGIKLIGAGVGKTIIIGNYLAPNMRDPSDPANYLIAFRPTLESATANEPFRLSGFTFDCSGLSIWLTLSNNRLAKMNQIRVDHNSVRNVLPGNGILVKGTVYGVIDNNIFNFDTIRFYALNAANWKNQTFDFGTADNIYIEDNDWTSAGAMTSAGHGSRYCIRHNTITNVSSTTVAPCFDAHGNQPGGIYATMGTEIYGNTIVQTNNRSGNLLDHRGGKAVVYNNSITSTSGWWIRITEEHDDYISPPAINPISGQPQYPSEGYYWNNLRNGSRLSDADNPRVGSTIDYNANGNPPYRMVPQVNRDGFGERVPFSGSSGVGVGLLSARPDTCTLNGAGYWATDESKLYRWTGSAWQSYYTPYPYPHPQRGIIN